MSLHDGASVRYIIDGAEVEYILRGPDGPVMRMLVERSTRVQLAARAQINAKAGRSTALAADLTKRPSTIGGNPAIQVGSWNKDYALYVHDGTRAHEIRPRTKKALAFFDTRGGINATPGRVVKVGRKSKKHPNGVSRTVNTVVKVVHHPGTAANRFLTDNLHLVVED